MLRKSNWEYWNRIETAPPDTDVMLIVEDGAGSQYRLLRPCQLTGAGWVTSARMTALAVKPIKWRRSMRARQEPK